MCIQHASFVYWNQRGFLLMILALLPSILWAQEIFTGNLSGKECLFLGSISTEGHKAKVFEEGKIRWEDMDRLQQTGSLPAKEFLDIVFKQDLQFNMEGYEPFWSATLTSEWFIFTDPETMGENACPVRIVPNNDRTGHVYFMFEGGQGHVFGLVNRAGLRDPAHQEYCEYIVEEDEKMMYSVFLTIGDKTYKGCVTIVERDNRYRYPVYQDNGQQAGYLYTPTTLDDCENCYTADTISVLGQDCPIHLQTGLRGLPDGSGFFFEDYMLDINETSDKEAILRFNSTLSGNSYWLYITKDKQGAPYIYKELLFYPNAMVDIPIGKDDFSSFGCSHICIKNVRKPMDKTIRFSDYFDFKETEATDCFDCPLRYSLDECLKMRKKKRKFIWIPE